MVRGWCLPLLDIQFFCLCFSLCRSFASASQSDGFRDNLEQNLKACRAISLLVFSPKNITKKRLQTFIKNDAKIEPKEFKIVFAIRYIVFHHFGDICRQVWVNWAQFWLHFRGLESTFSCFVASKWALEQAWISMGLEVAARGTPEYNIRHRLRVLVRFGGPNQLSLIGQ